VSGHDFSRADKACKIGGLQPLRNVCKDGALLRDLLFAARNSSTRLMRGLFSPISAKNIIQGITF
jgi:hypothetical protein